MTHLIDYGQLEFINSTLREILGSIEDEFGPQTITSLYRINDAGVHGQLPLRGTDIRCRNHSFGGVITEWVNSAWSYDPLRPDMKVAVAHGAGSNYHIHLQVHVSTIRRIHDRQTTKSK